MIVTKFHYSLPKNLITKLDLMIKRCAGNGSKKDTVLICEGGEGEGKTTLSIALAYYVAEQTGRKFSAEHMFFDVGKMIKFAQDTEEQIIIWDEPALQALSTDWASSAVKNLTRLLMMARKKRHFIIINMTKFYKFNEYIVVDRSIAMLHVYSRKNIHSGHFMYIKRKRLEALWRDYRFSKRRNYAKHQTKNIQSTFPDILNPKHKNNVLSEFDNDAYERAKDEAIGSIGVLDVKLTPAQQRRKLLIEFIEKELQKDEVPTQKELAERYGVSLKSIQRFTKEINEKTLDKKP